MELGVESVAFTYAGGRKFVVNVRDLSSISGKRPENKPEIILVGQDRVLSVRVHPSTLQRIQKFATTVIAS